MKCPLVLPHLRSQTKKLTLTVSRSSSTSSTSSSIDYILMILTIAAMMGGDGAFLFFQVGNGIDDFWLADKLLDLAEYVHMWI